MIKEFENWLNFEKRYSIHTVKSYLNDLSQFKYFLEESFNELDLLEAKPQYIKSWIIQMMDNDFSPTTVNRKLVSLNSFYNYLIKEGKISVNPVNNIHGPKVAKKIVKYIEEEEILTILDGYDFGEDFVGKRDQLILEMLYGTGIRLSELINLKSDFVDLDTLIIKVLGKRNKERIIPINISLKNQIVRYKEIRNEYFEINPNENLFVTEKGKPLYPMLVYRVVKKHLEGISSKANVSPHVLRHSFATHLINKGADINAIKELLGHANLAATQIYTHNTVERLKKVFKQAHPRG